jgi:hypothetical protein
VQGHVKIAPGPLLVLVEGTVQYAGLYWAGTTMVVTEELGSAQDPMPLTSRESAVSG